MDKNLDDKISERIKEEINTSSKTKSQIAKEIGVSNATISQYLSGKIQPTLSTFSKLCKCLDVSSDEILGLK